MQSGSAIDRSTDAGGNLHCGKQEGRMSARRTRIIKEARAIFWPWCAVMLAEGVTWLSYRPGVEAGLLWPEISLTFWIGVPILATLPLGAEFQHRTLPVLLSQPIDRMKLWSEKGNVMSGVVLATFLVHWLGQRAVFSRELHLYSNFTGLWVITTVCSATFWTLVARSTMGGVILNVVQGLGMMISLNLTGWAFELQPAATVTRTALVAAALAYAIVMVWLGRRKLARFQVTGAFQSDDLLMIGANVTRGGVAGLLRC